MGGRAIRSDHRCAVYSSDAEKTLVIRSFLAEGTGDDAVFVGDEPERFLPPGVRAAPVSALHRGGTPFDATRAMRRFRAEADRPAEAPALRAVADLSHVIADPTSFGGIVQYELQVDEAMAGRRVHALCLFDARKIHHRELSTLVATHSVGCELPGSRFTLLLRGDEAHLIGEVDADNAASLLAALRNVPRAVQRLELGALDFLDAAAGRALATWLHEATGTGRPVRLTSVGRLPAMVLGLYDLGGAIVE